jgi:4-amino-4-deoxy-L-arabinose transferase-like glycosyltransferase
MKTVLFQLAAIAVLFMTPVMWRLGDSDVLDHMETLSLLSAQESWLRHHAGDSTSWLIPTMGSQPRINKPPMLQWITGLVWSDLTPETGTIAKCVWRARMVAALLTLIGIFSAYALAYLWGGRTLAWLSGVVLATLSTVLEQGRLACYDTYLFAGTTVSISAAAWLLARGETWPLLKRTALALLSGAALSLAVLTKGPIALFFVGVPLAVLAFYSPTSNRTFRAATIGVTFAPGIVFLLLWFAHVGITFGDTAHAALLTEYRAAHEKHQPFWYYLSIVAWVLPWTFSFLGVILAFRLRKSLVFEKPFKIASLWLGLILVIMSLHEAKRQRYLVPAMPAVAIFIAYWWQWLEQRTLPERWASRFRIAHTSLLGIGCLMLPLVVPLYPLLLRSHLVTQPLPESIPVGAIAVATLGLLGLTWAIWKDLGSRPLRACALTGLWVSVVFSVGVALYTDSGNAAYADRAAAERLGRCITAPRMYFLQANPRSPEHPDAKFIFYSRKIPEPVTRETLRPILRTESSVWILAKPDEITTRRLEEMGFVFVETFKEKRAAWDLFHKETPGRESGSEQIPRDGQPHQPSA